MMKVFNRLFLFLLGLMLAQTSFAFMPDIWPSENFFQDGSAALLGKVIGSVGTIALPGAPNPIIQSAFERFNTMILTLGGIIVSYSAVMSITNSAQDGSPLGKKFSTTWMPMRTAVGMVILVPSPASGYSMIQVMVMWVIVQGIGAANALWVEILDGLDRGDGVASVSGKEFLAKKIEGSAGVTPMIENIFRSEVCNSGLRHLYTIREQEGHTSSEMVEKEGSFSQSYRYKDYPPKVSEDGRQITLLTEFHSGVAKSANPTLRYMCGSFLIETKVNKSRDDPDDLESDLEGLANRIHSGKILAFRNLSSFMRGAVNSIVRDENIKENVQSNSQKARYLTRNKELIANAKKIYSRQLTGLTVQRAPSGNFDAAKEAGWIFAAAYYKDLVSPNAQKLSLYATVMNETPAAGEFDIPNGTSKSTILTEGLQNVSPDEESLFLSYIRAAEQIIAAASKSERKPNLGFGIDAVDMGGIMAIFGSVTDTIMDGFQSISNVEEASKEPIFAIGELGATLMKSAEIGFISFISVTLALYMIGGMFSAVSPIPYIISTMLMSIGVILLGFLVIVWSQGAMLAIYVPMIPYLVFTVSALGWVFSVVEAVIAAPIIAIGLLSPSPDEIGKIIPGLNILLGVFLKPPLMLFGLIFSIRILNVVMRIVNDTFFHLVNQLPGYQASFMFGPVLAFVAYVSLTQSFVSQSAKLIYMIHGSVLKYINARAAPSLDIDSAISEIEQRSQAGINAVSEVQKGATEAAMRHTMQSLEAKNKEKAGGDKGGGGGGGGKK